MSLDADAIVDRRRIRRKLTFWRVSALAIALIAIGGAVWLLMPGNRFSTPGAYIARIKVQGLIRGNQDRVEALGRLGRSAARAVIVHIDSPGGTTAGSEQLFDALRELQSKKPMVVVVDGLAASRRLHRRAFLRTHRGAGNLAGRVDRRAVSISELHGCAENHRNQGRGSEVLATEGCAERF